MPAVSKAQQRLMGAAEHGATFPLAKKVRSSMSHQQLHDFASGSQKGKPEHTAKKKSKSRRPGNHSSGSSGTPSGAVSTRPRVIANPKTLAGRRAASHAAAY